MAFAAPIPGANYTSDTKNYPWHRPPEFTSLDDAIEMSFKKLTEENAATGLLTMLEMGAPVSALTHTYVMSGIGAGKWTPDFAILLAGPISHIIYLMAKGYGIDPDMGIDNKVKPPTKSFFKARQIEASRVKDIVQNIDVEAIQENAMTLPGYPSGGSQGGGFMGMAGDQGEVAPDIEEEEQEEPEIEGMM